MPLLRPIPSARDQSVTTLFEQGRGASMLAMPIPTSLVALSAWPASQGIGVSQPLFVALFLFKKSEVSVLQTDSSLINFFSSKLNHLLIENLSVDRLMQLNGKVMAYYYDLCTCLLTTISGAHTLVDVLLPCLPHHPTYFVTPSTCQMLSIQVHLALHHLYHRWCLQVI